MHQPILETCSQIVQEQLPNLLRLYLNPYVTQTCFCLARYVETTWPGPGEQDYTGEYQTFLANCFDEALSGAIKLARYDAHLAGRPTLGLVVDPCGRLGPYASAPVGDGKKVEFVPGLEVLRGNDALDPSRGPYGLVILVAGDETALHRHAEGLRQVVLRDAPLVIPALDRSSLASLRSGDFRLLRDLVPDIVIFDESFADHAVPFSAFTARRALFDHWNKRGKTTFHSTTYQPNTISSLHFMRCLEAADPEFHATIARDLDKIAADLAFRGEQFRRLYSPSLYRAIRATGFDTADIRAADDFVILNGRRIFDAVSGVACSIRGHNPPNYVAELASFTNLSLPDCQAELGTRLHDLTGLDCFLPAVSGATAVENALKLALVAQYPRRHVLALKSGFGGKTLLALTGTSNAAYKEHIDPLYADVLYVDPFAPDAETQIEAALQQHPVAVVQMELIQAVGGVRRVPEKIVRLLGERRLQGGYLLLVDEVQTGMYRTGPFLQSRAMGLTPDIVLVGKGTSDMMFPGALTLYSAGVQDKLDRIGSDLPTAIRQGYGYEFGYRTMLNVLRRAEELTMSQRVAEAGDLVDRLLKEGLASCKAVREVRVHGLLIGIELDAAKWPRRWFRKRLYSFYLYGMLQHRGFPVLVGFCQYEPNVLKITPALTVSPEAIQGLCATIIDVLSRPFHRLLTAALGGLMKTLILGPKRGQAPFVRSTLRAVPANGACPLFEPGGKEKT
jgi:acetylornithine/succinyldiaminopimelate/putrescine aminotransferase